MKRSLVTLMALVIIARLGVLAAGLSQYTSDDLAGLLALLALGVLAERYAIGLFSSDVSLGVVAVLVAAIIGGLWGVALVAPAIVLAGQIGSESEWYKRCYNAGVYLLAGAAFAMWFNVFGSSSAPEAWPAVLAPALLGAISNFAVNSFLIAGAISLSEDEPFLATWKENYLWLVPQYTIIGLAAMAAASAYAVLGIWGFAVFATPVLGVRMAMERGAHREVPRDGADIAQAA